MNTLEFAREIEKANRRLVELRRGVGDEAKSKWAETALAELSSAVEELRVAEEELVTQNEELAVAHAQAEYQRHRYRELFMGSPHGQVLTDLRGTIAEGNRAAAELLGLPPAAMNGKPLHSFVALDDRDRFQRWVALLKDASHDASVCSECGGSAKFVLKTALRAAGFPCDVLAAPLPDRYGRISTIRWFLRDVSDREQAIEADRLKDEARRKDEFLAVLGHELRNPLAAITLAADILTGTSGDVDRRRWAAEVVQRHADQLSRLVEDLLDVSRVSHGKIALHQEEVDLRHVVAAAVESCQAILDGKGHTLTVSLPDGPVALVGDPARLTQIVANLVDNAAKYTPSGGGIRLEVTRKRDAVVISVEDTGIGLAPEALDRIFTAYQQVDRNGKLRERGLGLGLALVKQLVTLHGGSVQASSAGDGQGATFTVKLPIHGGARAAAAARAARNNGQTGLVKPGQRVLVVDDNADAAELMAERLRRSGYEVDLAFDGTGGLEAARRTRCQVALVDLGLPDVDGFEVCRALKAEQPGIRLVAVTGYSDAAARRQAAEAGFDRFLVKPLDPREVAAAVTELFGDAHES